MIDSCACMVSFLSYPPCSTHFVPPFVHVMYLLFHHFMTSNPQDTDIVQLLIQSHASTTLCRCNGTITSLDIIIRGAQKMGTRSGPTSNRTWDFGYCNDINGCELPNSNSCVEPQKETDIGMRRPRRRRSGCSVQFRSNQVRPATPPDRCLIDQSMSKSPATS